MSVKEKCSNPMMALVVVLVVFIVCLLATFIILKSSDHRVTVGNREALVAHEVTVDTTVGRPTVPSTVPSTVIPTRPVCVSPECITLAHQLHNWHDPSIDPCQDFYKFSCGKYNEHTVVQGTRSTKKEEIVNKLMIEFFKKNETSNSRSENVIMNMYRACEQLKDEEFHDQIYDKLLKEVLTDINFIGSWPLLHKKWDESKFNLNEMLTNLAKLGKMDLGFFELQLVGSPFLELAGPVVGEAPDPIVRAIAKEVLNLTAGVLDETVLDKDLKDVQVLYKELFDKAYDGSEEKATLKELEKQLPSINFQSIFENLMHPKKKYLKEKVMEHVGLLRLPLFFDEKRNLEHILKDTPKRVIANFLIFQFLYKNFQSMSLGKLIVTDRICDVEMKNLLPQASLRVFVQNYFDRENIKIVAKMMEETKESFIETIQESTWLHEKTKETAILKVKKMRTMVGYPEEFEEAGALDNQFETLDIRPSDTYYKMFQKLRKFNTQQIMEFVGMELKWNPMANLMEANAFYLPEDNSMSILVPFLDDPLFDSTYPKYAKIAGTGSTLAHEMGHGFDTSSRNSDENGKQRDWWRPEDTVEYDKRAHCLVEQYNNYDDPDFGKNLDGTVTLDEMLADGFGAETSWRAFSKLDLSKEPGIVGFDKDYSIQKLYFRIGALDFCSPRSAGTLDEVLGDTHPTGSFRVNGVYSNMKAFGETYNCPIGSPMNPKKKCELF